MSLGFFIAYDLMAAGPFLDQAPKSSAKPSSDRCPHPPLTLIENDLRSPPEPPPAGIKKERAITPSQNSAPIPPEPLRGQIGTNSNSATHRIIKVTR